MIYRSAIGIIEEYAEQNNYLLMYDIVQMRIEEHGFIETDIYYNDIRLIKTNNIKNIRSDICEYIKSVIGAQCPNEYIANANYRYDEKNICLCGTIEKLTENTLKIYFDFYSDGGYHTVIVNNTNVPNKKIFTKTFINQIKKLLR